MFPGVLLAGFFNLLAVVVLAPPLGRCCAAAGPTCRASIASNYAGAWLLVAAISVLLFAGGLVHRSAARAEEGARAGGGAAMHDYVVEQAPQYRARSAPIDAVRLEPDYYRACVPGATRATGSACS